MAKKAYIGVDGIARKIKKGYIGVDGVARKIKKAYIGIGGVARPCWGSDEPVQYYGVVATHDDVSGLTIASTTLKNHAIFAGGYKTYNNPVATVKVYDASLTLKMPQVLDVPREQIGATTVGNYALFAGGYKWSQTAYTNVDAYDESLTHITATELQANRAEASGGTVGNHALFYCGKAYGAYWQGQRGVNAYDEHLTRTNFDTATADYGAEVASNGVHVLFGSGSDNTYMAAYDASLTQYTPEELTYDVDGCGARAGDYALFSSGDAYDTSLTKIITGVDRFMCGSSTEVGGMAMFHHTQMMMSSVMYENTFLFDPSLTKTTLKNEILNATGATEQIGNFVLFSGATNIYAYTVT